MPNILNKPRLGRRGLNKLPLYHNRRGFRFQPWCKWDLCSSWMLRSVGCPEKSVTINQRCVKSTKKKQQRSHNSIFLKAQACVLQGKKEKQATGLSQPSTKGWENTWEKFPVIWFPHCNDLRRGYRRHQSRSEDINNNDRDTQTKSNHVSEECKRSRRAR
jgi:hypothetical protein